MGSGRLPEEGVTRDFSLRVRLTPADRADIDEARGSRTVSAFARDAIRTAVKDAKGRKK